MGMVGICPNQFFEKNPSNYFLENPTDLRCENFWPYILFTSQKWNVWRYATFLEEISFFCPNQLQNHFAMPEHALIVINLLIFFQWTRKDQRLSFRDSGPFYFWKGWLHLKSWFRPLCTSEQLCDCFANLTLHNRKK